MKRIERTLTIQKGRQKRDESVTGKTKQEQHTMLQVKKSNIKTGLIKRTKTTDSDQQMNSKKD